MRKELTSQFKEQMEKQFPILKKAEKAIYEVMGITIDDIRGCCHEPMYVQARIIFANVCSQHVYPNYYLASYMGHSHTSGYFWSKRHFDNLSIHDKIYEGLWNRVNDELKKIE